jgi:glutaredoxin 3
MGRSSVDVQAEEQVKDALAERDVVVIFSKTYCGFCAAVKRLFERLGIRYRALELDILPLGSAMQRILYEMTGQRTVPSVWVRGRHLGGNDAVQELHRTGRLLPLLDESGIAHAWNPNARLFENGSNVTGSLMSGNARFSLGWSNRVLLSVAVARETPCALYHDSKSSLCGSFRCTRGENGER